MSERARLANVPMPETALKCPRCESTNTKFCYFNNYSLSQPRHFCKTCRRYWTRGGALRNVPVGGGCRRNKRTKSTSSNNNSPVSSSDRQTNNSSNSTNSSTVSSTSVQIPPLGFLSPLSQLTSHDHHFSASDINLNNYGGISTPVTSEMNFQLGTNFLGINSNVGVGVGIDQQWRLPQAQQFPFLGGLDLSSSALYGQLQGSIEPSSFVGETSHQVRPKLLSSAILTQLASVKMEEHNQDQMNLSRQLMMGIPGNDTNNLQWNSGSSVAAAWTDLSSFSSSSTSNPL